MGSLSRAQVNRLVRLHQRGVEGADAQLLELAQTCPKTLAEALNVPFERLEANMDPSAIAELAKESASHSRQDREQRALEEAQVLAERIAQEAQHHDGQVRLDHRLMMQLAVYTRAAGDLVIIRDDVLLGVLAFSVLRAVMRNCSSCVVDALYLEGPHLVLRYRTDSTRGGYRFILGAPKPMRPRVELRLRAPRKRFLEHLQAEVGR